MYDTWETLVALHCKATGGRAEILAAAIVAELLHMGWGRGESFDVAYDGFDPSYAIIQAASGFYIAAADLNKETLFRVTAGAPVVTPSYATSPFARMGRAEETVLWHEFKNAICAFYERTDATGHIRAITALYMSADITERLERRLERSK